MSPIYTNDNHRPVFSRAKRVCRFFVTYCTNLYIKLAENCRHRPTSLSRSHYHGRACNSVARVCLSSVRNVLWL